VGITDRYWAPITPAEAEAVLGRPVEIRSAHLRWLFAVARCRWDGGEAIVKRQPAMGRRPAQVLWQHRLTNHLADLGVPAARSRRLITEGAIWYEISDVAAGRDIYSGVDTWEPFASLDHSREAGRMLARLHEAGATFAPAQPQPQIGFVVQIDHVREEPDAALRSLARARPAVADYLGGGGGGEVRDAYGELFDRLRPLVSDLPRRPLHGDWQTNNLFFEDDRISGIIDFHQADHGPRLLDLATAVERNCFFWNRISDGDDGALDLDHAAGLIAAYHAEAPLLAVERRAFADVLACCQFEYGISFLDYYWGVEQDREKADWAWHTFVLGHARWWATEAGRRVHQRIARIAEEL
jgi:Ser/Thr protein kinase RdoA (MazF antagonist)